MPKTTKAATRQPKSMKDRVVNAAGRRPVGRDKIAERLGVSPNAVARALGEATNEGRLIKSDKGYTQA